MKKLKKIVYGLHRILGTVFSILFVMWFISGFVLIYHYFPRVVQPDRMARMDSLCSSDNLPPIEDYSFANVRNIKIELNSNIGEPHFFVTSSDTLTLVAVGGRLTKKELMNKEQWCQYANRWCDARIARIDTLYDLEQWIPFSRLRAEFPIYKFYFSDNARHQLYTSSRTGEVLQFTDKGSRFWSWVGAIPHWVYFTRIRQNADLWKAIVIPLAGTGTLMCLLGIILGIRSFRVYHKAKKKFGTPYRKFDYKWHHLLGSVFGLFVFTYIFSGMMSLQKVPQWLVKTHNKDIATAVADDSMPMEASRYKLDYRRIIDTYSGRVKSIEWAGFGDMPVYKAFIDGEVMLFDASADTVGRLLLNKNRVEARMKELHTEPFTVELMNEYDNYYVNQRRQLPLPVYKVTVNDMDGNTHYVNPETGEITNYNSNTRLRKWLYQGIHCFKIKFLVERPWLWNIIVWTTMIGGLLVSLTGVMLSIRYLRRKFRRLKK